MTKAKRNDPCPCGSGKKYKKCCWEKDQKGGFTASQLSGGPSSIAGLFNRAMADVDARSGTEAPNLKDLFNKKKAAAEEASEEQAAETKESQEND